MALIIPGAGVGQISGRLGSTVFARNRYGSYARNGTPPITSTTSYALNAKARLGTISSGWKSLTDAQRAAWSSWAAQNPIMNRLGQSVIMAGNAAYIKLNTRLALDSQTLLTAPPIIPPPAALATLAQACDIGLGSFGLTYTATPLGAGTKLWIEAAVSDSAAINYIQNLKRWVGTSAAAQASPFDHQSIVEARFGTLVVGQTVSVMVSIFDTATGLLSPPLRADTVVTTT